MKQQLLVIGAGFGGLWSTLSAARLLDMHDRHDVEITLLAPQAELRIRPRFYEPDVHSMYAPLDALLAAVGVRFVKGTAESIDSQARRVGYRDEAGRPGELTYDRLVLASGSQLARPPVPGLKENAFDVDQIESAARLEHHLHALASQPASAARNTVVIAGGGFTGIETATEMPNRLRAILGELQDIRVIIVDRSKDIAATMGDGIRPSIIEASKELGIEWIIDATVAAVDANGVVTSTATSLAATVNGSAAASLLTAYAQGTGAGLAKSSPRVKLRSIATRVALVELHLFADDHDAMTKRPGGLINQLRYALWRAARGSLRIEDAQWSDDPVSQKGAAYILPVNFLLPVLEELPAAQVQTATVTPPPEVV